ncbi:GIY-YIG nuclease family protein [Lacticaseibacillus saniviri]
MNKDEKKQKIQLYKQESTYYGVIQIKNSHDGKVYIDTVPNVKNRWHFYQLNLNRHFYRDTPLQRAWDEEGADAFTFEVLWQEKADDVINMRQTLKDLKIKWLNKLQPYNQNGYNQPPKEF